LGMCPKCPRVIVLPITEETNRTPRREDNEGIIGGAIRVLLASAIVVCCEDVEQPGEVLDHKK
jgi:hypothetical protein